MSSLDWDGSRAVTLGGWVRLVDTRGWTDESVWLVVHDAARAALSAVRRSLRPGEAEELVAEVVVVARGVPESWRVPDRAGVVLVRWLGGVMKRRLLAMRRAEFALAGENLTDVEGPDPPDDTGTREPPSVDAAALLTEKQLATWESACRGLGSRTAARQLGITRGAYRDRLRRAKGRRHTTRRRRQCSPSTLPSAGTPATPRSWSCVAAERATARVPRRSDGRSRPSAPGSPVCGEGGNRA